MALARANSSEPADLAANRASFILYLRAEGKAESTVVTYTKAIDQLVAYLDTTDGPASVADIDEEDIRGFLVALRERGMKPATRAQRYRSLQAWFKFLVNEGRIEASPLARMHPPAVAVQPPPVLRKEQIDALLRSAAGTGFEERRDRAILALFIDTGVRRAELSNLKLDDVDLAQGMAYVVGKGSRGRWVQFGRKVAQALDRYVYARNRHPAADEEWFWLGQKGRLTETGVEQVVKRRAKQAGLVDGDGRVWVHPHLFRHTFAHEFLADGGNEGELMSLTGWKSRQMVDRYGASAAAERARAAQRRHSLMDRLG